MYNNQYILTRASYQTLLVSETSTSSVARALVSEQSRRILLALIEKPMSIDEIAEQQVLPLSSCYKTIRELENHGIVKKTKSVFSKKGKKSGLYVSMIRNANIRFLAGSLSVDLEMNDGAEVEALTREVQRSAPIKVRSL